MKLLNFLKGGLKEILKKNVVYLPFTANHSSSSTYLGNTTIFLKLPSTKEASINGGERNKGRETGAVRARLL